MPAPKDAGVPLALPGRRVVLDSRYLLVHLVGQPEEETLMGRWGPAVFESDDALDYLGDFMDRLENLNEAILADPERFALDEDGSAIFMANVELMCIICEQLPVASPPEPPVVHTWRERFLAMFDNEIEWLSPREGFATS